VYSQNDEDGIIEDCLSRIAQKYATSKTFIEFGCGNGLENNTHYLLLKGYRGCWLDGNSKNIDFISQSLSGLTFEHLLVREKFVNVQIINEILSEFSGFIGTTEPDFFSLDTDGNDVYFVDQALKSVFPKLICVEYNAKFPPPLAVSIPYNETHRWSGDDYAGASIQKWVDLLSDYKLVACSLSGVNAFFARIDVADVFEAYDVKELYQPARYWIGGLQSGHPASLKWLIAQLQKSAPDNIELRAP